MAVKYVKGLGYVKIAGDVPTEEEKAKLRALRDRKAREQPEAQYMEVAPPAVQEAGSPLAGLKERVSAIEDPREAEGIEQLVRGIGSGAIGVTKGALLDTGLAAAEAVLGREEVEKSPSFRLSQEIEAIQEGLYKPSVSFDDVLESPTLGNVPSFVGEGIASSIPGMAAAVVSMPRYALSMVGDIAKQRAANRGPAAEVSASDLVAALPTAGVVAGAERLGGRQVLGRGTAATAPGRIARAAAIEPATEFGQEFAQTVGEQALTREGDDLVLGVDVGEGVKRGAAGALIGGAMGLGGSSLAELKRLPSERTVSKLERELEAIEKRQAEPASVAEEVTEEVVTPTEEVVAEGDIVEQAMPTQEVTAQEAEAQAAEEVAVEGAKAERKKWRQRVVDETAPRPKAEPVVKDEMIEEVDVSTPEEDLRSAAYDPFASDKDVEAALGAANAVLNEEGMASRKVDYEEDLRAKLEEQGIDYDDLTAKQRVGYQDLVNALDGRELRSKIVVGEDGVPALQSTEGLDTLRYAAINKKLTPYGSDILALNNAIQTARRAQAQLKDLIMSDDATPEQRIAAEQRLDSASRVEIESMLALRLGAGQLGRAMRSIQYVVNPDLTLNQAKASAMHRLKRELTPKEESEIDKFWAKAEREVARTKGLYQSTMRDLKSARARNNSAVERGAPEADLKRLDKAVKKAADRVQSARSQAQQAQKRQATVSQEATAGMVKRAYGKAFGLGIAMNSAGDASALGRQAIFLAMQNPVEALKTAKWMFKAAPWSPGHREFARSEMQDMLSSRTNQLFTAAGGELTEVEGMSNSKAGADPLTSREENFMFNISERGLLGRTVGGGFLIPSQNIFALTLNRMRLANFSKGVELLAQNHAAPGQPADVRNVPRQDIEGLARLINVSTGRTTGKLNSDQLGFLRHVMFAPRFTMSRVENVYRAMQAVGGFGEFGKSLSPTARKQFTKRIGANLGYVMGLAAMAAIASSDRAEEAKERMDSFYTPGSPDFLKGRGGDTHIDLMGGTSATVRYLLPYTFTPLSGDDVLSSKDLDTLLRGGLQLANNKLAPLYQAMRSMVFNKDWRMRDLEDVPYKENPGLIFERWVSGGEKGLDGALAHTLNRFIFPAMGIVAPIPLKSVAEDFIRQSTEKEMDLVEKVLVPQALQFFGVGAQVYDPKKYRKGAIPKLPTPPRMPRP